MVKKLTIAFLLFTLIITASFSAFATTTTTCNGSERDTISITSNFETAEVPDLLNFLSIKIDPPISTLLTDEAGKEIADVTITDQSLLDFSVKNGIAVHYVFVKGGTGGGGTLYKYNPACSTSDTGLIANLNSQGAIQNISHYTFYYSILDKECKGETAWALGSTNIMTKGNWATFFEFNLISDPISKKLMAGQHIEIGTVNVKVENDHLVVTYNSSATLEYTHLYVGVNKPTSAAPGQFPFKGTQNFYSIPLTYFDGATTIYIAAHADALICN